ncbi:MAG: hypothetical protein ACOY0T_02795 [Myxococcota bacterium]
MKCVEVSALSLLVCAVGLVVTVPAAAQTDAKAEAAAEGSAEATAEGADKAAPAEEKKAAPAAAEAAPSGDQRKRALNTVYAEGLGAGLVYSINYERLVLEDLGVRAGFSYMSFSASAGTASSSATFITVPVTASYLGVGSKHHILELGGGLSMLFASGTASGVGASSSGSGMAVLPNALLGYRLHPVDGAGFNFRVGAMAFVGKGLGFSVEDPEKVGVLPWFYLSMGASF